MYVSINGTDISKNIDRNSYHINSEDVFDKIWQDANGRWHKDVIRQQIKGTFSLAIYGNKQKLDDFVELVNSASSNGVITITLFVANTGEIKTISAYYKMTSGKHIDVNNSNIIVNQITFEIEER